MIRGAKADMPSLRTQIQWFTRIQQVLVLILLFVAAVFYWLVFRPETGRLQNLVGRISQKERELTQAQTQALVLPQVQADINHLHATLADFKKLPANPGDLGEFQIELAQLAKEDHLEGWSVSWPGTPKRDEQFYELPISLKFNGDFLDVYAFLRQMDDLSRLTRVKNLSVKGDDSDGKVQVEVMMDLYYSEG
jgi:Tfp pilus assembly protein PilO